MFCPKCGNPDQAPETYCRRCGTFLPDLSKPGKPKARPEDHIKANAFLSAMSVITSFTLAILLYWRFLGRDDTPFIIYLTAGFLIAMGCWQVQTFWRTLLLKRHFNKPQRVDDEPDAIDTTKAAQLNEANFDDMVPTSIAEDTTRQLQKRKPDLS